MKMIFLRFRHVSWNNHAAACVESWNMHGSVIEGSGPSIISTVWWETKGGLKIHVGTQHGSGPSRVGAW